MLFLNDPLKIRLAHPFSPPPPPLRGPATKKITFFAASLKGNTCTGNENIVN